jgi:hypothetical protein
MGEILLGTGTFLLGILVTYIFHRLQTQDARKQNALLLEQLEKLRREKRVVTWNEVALGAEAIFESGVNGFTPDIMITFSDTAMIVAGLVQKKVREKWRKVLPVGCLTLQTKGDDTQNHWFPEEDQMYETGGWRVFVPKWLLEKKGAKILIIVDAVSSAQSVTSLRSILEDEGFEPDNIMTWTILEFRFSSEDREGIGRSINRVIEVDHPKVEFPWGWAF